MAITCAGLPPFSPFPFSGTLSVPTAITDTVGGTVIDWCVCDNYGTPAPWSSWATLTLAQGGNAINAPINAPGNWGVAVRNHATQAIVCYSGGGIDSLFGLVLVVTGQSEGQRLSNLDTLGVVASPNTRMWLNGSWGAPTGTGVKTAANRLNGLTGWPVGVMMCAVGSTALTQTGYDTVAVLGSQNGYWLDTSGSLYANLLAALTAVGGKIHCLDHIGGQSDTLPAAQLVYQAGLVTFADRVASHLSWPLRMLVEPPGKILSSALLAAGADPAPIRAATRAFGSSYSGAFSGCDYWHMSYDSIGHLTEFATSFHGELIAHRIFEEVCGDLPL